MEILLRKASLSDAQKLYKLQTKSFQELLEKYHDIATNPGAEPIEKTLSRLKEVHSDYYFILFGKTEIGALRIKRDGAVCKLKQIYVLPAYRNRGYAQQAMIQAESLYPYAKRWELDTIQQEEKLCHLYEKLEYKVTGKEVILRDGMTLISYAK